MSIYPKRGDSGTTSLMNGISVSKSDDRIELLGTIDEDSLKEHVSQIQRQLMQIMAGIADPRNLDYRCPKEEILALEEGIDHMEASFPRAKEFVLYGGCELSARLDMARAIARRAERRFRKVAQYYGADNKAMQYLNRLSDYLYVAARYSDYLTSSNPEEAIRQEVIRNVMRETKAAR